MRTAEIYHKIDELKYSHSLRSPKILTVHKVLFEDELGDSIHKRKNEIKRNKKSYQQLEAYAITIDSFINQKLI